MWLIPLVWGWFAVGTHHGRRREVVEKLHESARDITQPTNEKADTMEHLPIKICTPEKYNNPITKRERFDNDVPKSILGFSIAGDELADGPFYNYARSGTWSHLTRKIIQIYVETNTVSTNQPSDSTLYLAAMNSQDNFPDNNSGGSTNYLTPNSSHPTGYSLFERVLEEGSLFQSGRLKRFGWKTSKNPETGSTWKRKLKAFFMAFLLHGVFGWSAFMIDYMTPTMGIGCRAFLCMMYSLISLFSCIYLIIASELADSWSSQFESYQWRMETEGHWKAQKVERPSYLLSVGSVGFRLLGKTLAIVNSFFIVLGCIFEFVGLYTSCFCKSCRLGLGERAYIAFLSSEELAKIARLYWYAGSGAAVFAVFIVCFYFTRLPRAK